MPQHIGIVGCSAEGASLCYRTICAEGEQYLVKGIFSSAAEATFQRIIRRMQGEGCDAVVLGCTEIPLLMHDGNSPLPTLDSTRLLARAALARATA